MLESLATKTVVITGASSGQGAAEAQLFARLGSRVLLADVQDELGADVAARIRDNGDRLPTWTSTSPTKRSWHGAPELGPGRGDQPDRPAAGIEATAELGPRLRRTGDREHRLGGRPDRSFRQALHRRQVGLRGGTKAAAMDLASWGIRVVAVHRGSIETPIVAGSDDFVAGMTRSTPAGRIGRPEEVAHVVAFLASDDASFVDGVDVPVDDGFTEFGLYHRVTEEVNARLRPASAGRRDFVPGRRRGAGPVCEQDGQQTRSATCRGRETRVGTSCPCRAPHPPCQKESAAL